MNAQLKRDYKLMFEIQKIENSKKYAESQSQIDFANFLIDNIRDNLSWNIK